MIKIVTINDKQILNSIINNAEYGTMALSLENKPYSIPFNFVQYNDILYFHGSQKGKKIDIIKENSFASFSIVEDYSIIQSYFSTDTGDASPTTHLFNSIIMDGYIEIVNDYDEKVGALQALMEKYQPEGNFKHLSDKSMYEKMINATGMFKFIPETTTGKVKLGQNWNKEKFDRVIKHLRDRGSNKDIETIKKMEYLQSQIEK